MVPVFNYGDQVTVEPYPNYGACTVGGMTVVDDGTTYTASLKDIENGYVVIEATGNGYINSVTVDYVEEAVATEALWDFKNGKPASITEVAIEGATGWVASTATPGEEEDDDTEPGPSSVTSVRPYDTETEPGPDEVEKSFENYFMYVDATASGAKFDVYNRWYKTENNAVTRTSNNDVQVNSGTIVRVPVKSPGDKITIVPNYYFEFTVGGIAATSVNTWEYIASVEEYNQGYVEIVSTGNCYFYSIQWDAYDGSYSYKESNVEAGDGISGIVKWDWATSGWVGQTTISASQALVSSSNSQVSMYISIPSGESSGSVRFDSNQNHIQVSKDIVFYIPCEKGDILTVNAYNDEQYVHYTIGNETTVYQTTQTHLISSLDFVNLEETSLSEDVKTALAEISEKCGKENFIAVTSTDDQNYYLSIQMEYFVDEGSVKTKCLYSTSWTEWEEFDRKTENKDVTVAASYGSGDITFTFNGVGVYPNGEISDYVGYMMTAKYTDQVSFEPSVVTSVISSVTKIELTQASTGSKRGIMVSVKGEGDDDWVKVHQSAISSQSGESLTIDCGDRTNCQIKFENLYVEEENLDGRNQNAYVTDLAIYGKIDFGDSPMLDTFTFNDDAFTADDVFQTTDADGNWIGTIQVTKDESRAPSATNLPNVTHIDNGELITDGAITYTEPATGEKYGTVTIKLVNSDVEGDPVYSTYILSFEDKPDYTVSYVYDDAVVGTQTIEKDATIGEFVVTSDDLKLEEPAILRGWVLDLVKENKIDESYVIISDLSIYALVTDKETQNGNSRYKYNLNDKYFDIDDHECITTTGTFHDTTHGYQVQDATVTLEVGPEAYIIFGMCTYDATGSTITLTIGDEVVDQITDIVKQSTFAEGEAYIYHYNGGEPATVLVTTTGDVYFHYITINNVADLNLAAPTMQDGDYFYYVDPIDGDDDATNKQRADAFLTVLDIAGATAGNSRVYIFLPNGTYDLGYECLTPVPGNNMSIIGQSMKGTIIKNEAPEEGIAVSATLFNSTTGLYMQDLTLQNAYDYYGIGGSAGRADCFQDEGKHTICKNIRMLSYQDTYYSHNDNEHYFETSEIHGIVDYLCGSGDIYFYQCTMYNEGRAGYLTASTSPTYMTAPNTGESCNFGYVFESCIVDGIDGQCYSFGRSWDYTARCVWLNTTLKDGGANMYKYRWYESSMNVNPTLFGEYGTLPSCPESNIVPFKASSSTVEMETILTADEAAGYAYDKVFDTASWDPMAECEQVEISDLVTTIGSAEISWTGSTDALTYAVFMNTKLVGFTGATTFTLPQALTEDDYLEVRAANQNGGFGKAITFGENPDAITEVSSDNAELVGTAYFDLSGRKLTAPQRGINIAISYYSDGTQKSTKVLTK